MRTLLPREHGAWAQLFFPLGTGLLVATPTLTGLLLVVASMGVFFMHEPALVLLGRRGERLRTSAGSDARRMLTATALVALLSGGAAFHGAGPELRLALIALAALGAVVTALILMNRERSELGEMLAAATFSVAGAAVAFADGASLRTALTLALSWGLGFALSTLAVRAVTVPAHGRDEASRRHGRRLRHLAAVGALVVPASLASLMSLPATLAVLPFALLAGVFAFAPPPPKKLRVVGWSFVGASASTFGVLMFLVR